MTHSLRSLRRHPWRGPALSLAAFGLVALLASGAWNAGASSPVRASAPVSRDASAVTLPILTDGAVLQLPFGATMIKLTDTIIYGKSTPSQRSYSITIRAAHAFPLIGVQVETSPLTEWSIPGQTPGGPDALPPMSDWQWTVTTGRGVADTGHWAVPRWTTDLARATTWATQTYIVTGVSKPVAPLQVSLPLANPTPAPGVGIVLNPGSSFQGPLFPKNDPDYSTLLNGLKPSAIRFGEVDGGTSAHWSTSLGAPIFNFSALDRAFNLSASVGAKVLYSLSAGSWGDGNLLPVGMPQNHTYLIVKGSTSGYLADLSAYRAYLQVILTHIHSLNQSVGYWSVGNEIPLTNMSVG